jgi:hypothetical protein
VSAIQAWTSGVGLIAFLLFPWRGAGALCALCARSGLPGNA